MSLDLARAIVAGGEVHEPDVDAYDDPVMSDFVDHVTEALWGLLWSRPGLDTKTRLGDPSTEMMPSDWNAA